MSGPRSWGIPRNTQLLLTCEHGGNHIPRRYANLFEHHRRLLQSHRGYDHGALPLARKLRRVSGAPLIASVTSRLLIDLNRSLHHPDLFSERSRALPPDERQKVIDSCYEPYRARVEQTIASWIRQRRTVLHIGVHTFTPRLDGVVRRADVGLLYDPRRRRERAVCERWRHIIGTLDPALRVRRNYPYRGNADGLTTHLRRRFRTRYLGIELEVANRLLDAKHPTPITDTIAASLRRLLRIQVHRCHGGSS